MQTVPCDTWHRSFHPDKKFSLIPPGWEILIPPGRDGNPSFHPDISYPEFCPASVLPYPDVSQLQFYPTDIPPSPDVSQPQFCLADIPPSPVISHPAPAVGWGRRTIQLPRADMSGSFGNAYLECALDLSAIPTLSSWGLNHQTSRLSLLSA